MEYNKNELAKLVTDAEGLKKEISIAQIKEVLKILRTLIKLDPSWLAVLLK